MAFRSPVIFAFGFLALIAHARDFDEYHPEIADIVNRHKSQGQVRREIVQSDPIESERSSLLRDMDHDNYHPSPKPSSFITRALPAEEEIPQFWTDKAEAELQEALRRQKRNTNVAKNVIMFLGDGMGVPSVTAARILKGQKNGKGPDYSLNMDAFTHAGLSKTYNVDAQVADSAGTATAYLTGVKTDLGVLGVSAKVTPGVCSTATGNEVDSILKDSHKEGKSTGIVTTTRLNHATPAGAYAHSAYRYWYSDSDLPEEAVQNGCRDIAFQLYENLPDIEVALGGGRKYFRPKTTKDEITGSANDRSDGQELIEKWRQGMIDAGRQASYVTGRKQLNAVNIEETDHLWGMFQPADMNYDVDREADEPSLVEMTEKAIQMLQKNDKGFFLLVEGGRIDHGHHGSYAYRALHDVLAFDEAIQKAVDMTSDDDTLIVVTADHSHTFTHGGYMDRGNSIFGLAPNDHEPEIALDGRVYTGLLYGNGEGFQGGNLDDATSARERENVTVEKAGQKTYKQQSAVPRNSETHGGEDVMILARGPMAHLFHSVHQQSYIAHVMRYASCVGANKEHCDARDQTAVQDGNVMFLGNKMDKSSSEAALYSFFAVGILFVILDLLLVGLVAKKLK